MSHPTSTLPPHAPPEPAAAPRVLVAEDNEVNRKLLLRLLEKLGCAVVLAGDGLEAVERVAGEPVDLIFMDVQMPRLNGLEATAMIRKEHPHLPIIAVTAHAMAGDRERCLAAGMDDYLPKPLDLESVREKLLAWAPSNLIGTRWGCASRGSFDPGALLRRCEQDLELARELVVDFAHQASETLAELRAALAGGRLCALTSLAHMLKGSAGTVGVEAVAEYCRQLEHAGCSGDPDAAAGALHKLEAEWQQVAPRLTEWTTEER